MTTLLRVRQQLGDSKRPTMSDQSANGDVGLCVLNDTQAKLYTD